MSNGRSNGKTGSGQQPENDYGVPLQEILNMGQAAAQMLNSPIYNVAHQMAVQEIIAQWSATQPKEREKRESCWYELQAQGRAAQTMAGMVERAQQAQTAQSEGQANAEKEYLDRQGFGLDENFNTGTFN